MNLPQKFLLAGFLAATGLNALAAESYTLEPNHTQVLFTWNHFGFSNPSANFETIEGTLQWDEENPEKSSVNITIPVDSLDAHVERFDAHLRSKDFFEMDKYPTITFNSTGVQRGAGENSLVITGDLTMHGITKPVELDAILTKSGQHPSWQAPALGFDAATTLKRSDFGLDKLAPGVSDEVQLKITVEAVQTEGYQAALKARAARKARAN